MDRRAFLGTSAAFAAGLALAEEKKQVSASEKVTVALIGCGGMGRANLHDFMRLPDFEIAALCDVDPNQIQGAMNDVKKANRPTDKKPAPEVPPDRDTEREEAPENYKCTELVQAGPGESAIVVSDNTPRER